MAQRRNTRRGAHRSSNRKEDTEKSRLPEWETPCPLCGEPIKDIASAITERTSGNPAHFDCVMKKIAEEEEVQEDEKICYLGNGSFGIIQKRNSKQMNFFIRKRIQYEEKDSATSQTWRRNYIRTDVPLQGKARRKK